MAKFSLSWHKVNLLASKNYLAQQQKQLERMQADIERLKKSVAFAETQVAEAEKRGITEFDADRFLVPKRKKESV
jgi:hypothetical protein